LSVVPIQINAAEQNQARIRSSCDQGKKSKISSPKMMRERGIHFGFCLKCEGLEAQQFGSCEEFLSAVRPRAGNCLILDVHMPGMRGLELLE